MKNSSKRRTVSSSTSLSYVASGVDLGKGLVAKAFNFRMTGPADAAPTIAERKRPRQKHEHMGHEAALMSLSEDQTDDRSSSDDDTTTADVEKRAIARRERSERKSQALKSALAMQEEARRVKKRAELRLKLLEQSFVDTDAGARDELYGLRSVQEDIMEQPASIHWKLRLLYRVGRTFEDAAVAFNYSGYKLRFVLEDSPMLRSVLSGIESLMREQYLHVRRARLRQSQSNKASNATTPSISCVRAVSVVVECDSGLDLSKQIMLCKVMRARQDKLDPNCYLTITRTLNVMQDPVCAIDLVSSLNDAKRKYKL